jgi:hypothetical protein
MDASRVIPALLIRISIRPNRFIASCVAWSTSVYEAVFTFAKKAFPPEASISARVRFAFS